MGGVDVEFKYRDFKIAVQRLRNAGRDVGPRITRAHHRMGATVTDRAKLYAPKSPTFAEHKASSKATAKQWAAAGKRRTKDASSRRKPGALQNSIRFRATAYLAEVFVPTNSPAGAYAFKIHEEKGISWKKRGVGTVAKGPKADHKFIERAIKDSEADLVLILDDEISKATKEL